MYQYGTRGMPVVLGVTFPHRIAGWWYRHQATYSTPCCASGMPPMSMAPCCVHDPDTEHSTATPDSLDSVCQLVGLRHTLLLLPSLFLVNKLTITMLTKCLLVLVLYLHHCLLLFSLPVQHLPSGSLSLLS